MSASLEITNPATAEVFSTISADTPDTVAAKLARARTAQPSWAALPMETRLKALARFRTLADDRRDSFAALTMRETGKPITQARNELKGLLGRLDYFLEQAPRILADAVVFRDDSMEERISYEPLGVIGNISAWNYPYFVGSNVFVPALLAGNAVMYKPSEHATLTGLALAEALHLAGVPEDIFIPLIGAGPIGASLLEQRIDGVFFTGSYATGAKVAAAAGARLMKAQLELGGKDPVYVTDDVDPALAAAATADGAFYNNGQSCCAVERLYVHERIWEPFVNAFVDTVKGFRVGAPDDEATYIGPLTRRPQLDVLAAHVADATGKGARILTGGRRLDRKGFYFAPTVLVDVDHTMAVMREESFGPIIGIQKVASDAEATALMNDTPYGLTAGVYTRTRERANAILAAMNTGTVYWNCCDRVSPRLPWSGRGHSGVGSTLSALGIQAFVQPKAWHLRAPG